MFVLRVKKKMLFFFFFSFVVLSKRENISFRSIVLDDRYPDIEYMRYIVTMKILLQRE